MENGVVEIASQEFNKPVFWSLIVVRFSGLIFRIIYLWAVISSCVATIFASNIPVYVHLNYSLNRFISHLHSLTRS